MRVLQAAKKLDPEGGGGFNPPHRANRINAGFSSGETLSANFTPKSRVFPHPLDALRFCRKLPSSGALCTQVRAGKEIE